MIQKIINKEILDGDEKYRNSNAIESISNKPVDNKKKKKHKISILVEMMWCGHGKNLDCFKKG